MKLKDMFEQDERKVTNGGTNRLSATADLTQHADDIADDILEVIEGRDDADNLIHELSQSHDAMDKFINDNKDLTEEDIQYLKDEGDDVLDKMIRSQQSKRSRAKSKKLTFENFQNMLNAAIAENLLRLAADKPKQSGGRGQSGQMTKMTDEELAELANDPETLKKAIRNVQSKKSIYKAKADFDPESEKWKTLLETEETLKALRPGSDNEQVKKAIEMTKYVQDTLATKDINSLKAADAKELLEQIKQLTMKDEEDEQ